MRPSRSGALGGWNSDGHRPSIDPLQGQQARDPQSRSIEQNWLRGQPAWVAQRLPLKPRSSSRSPSIASAASGIPRATPSRAPNALPFARPRISARFAYTSKKDVPPASLTNMLGLGHFSSHFR
jgi:hypothetical protein